MAYLGNNKVCALARDVAALVQRVVRAGERVQRSQQVLHTRHGKV